MANGIFDVETMIALERQKRAQNAQNSVPVSAEGLLQGINFGGQSPMGSGAAPQPVMTPKPAFVPPPPPAEKPGMMDRIRTGLKDPATMAGLAAAFNQMTMNPNAQLQKRASDLMALRTVRNQSNQTVEMLRKSDDPTARQVADMIEANPDNASAIYQAYVTSQFKTPKETYTQMTGAQINRQMGVDAYEENAIFNVGGVSGKVSQVGGGGVAIDLGGDEPQGLVALDKAYATDHLDWTRGGGSDMAAQVAQINTVLQKMEEGAELTGPTIGLINNVGLLGLINPDAQDAKEQVEEVVQRNLRLVLGAQFTEKEGERLISRAYNPMLSPEKNIARLRKLYLQMEVSRKQREAMADYFSKNYTLRGYEGPQPNIGDFYTALSGLSVGQVQNGYEYLGGDRMVESNWKKVGP